PGCTTILMLTYEQSEELYAAQHVKFKRWLSAQWKAFKIWDTLTEQRMLLFYPTGAGKTRTALAMLAARGYKEAVVVAPPKTAVGWRTDAEILGLSVNVMSHEYFRRKTTKLRRTVPIIIDEFHKLGKHDAVGFQKLDRMAQVFPAIILCSATPNYND